MSASRILVFDSGLGGLTVLGAIRRLAPDLDITYLADNAVFPYGDLADDTLIRRVALVIGAAVAQVRPDAVVIACNTASTLVLPDLRRRFEIPIVGTVPAVKPAAAASRSGAIAVLATPGTVRRDYTRALIAAHAPHHRVRLVGSRHLAAMAEARLRGEPVDAARIAAEIAPCFAEDEEADGLARRTDAVALACTHFPLLAAELEAAAPWPVTWIDPAPAIARRLMQVLGREPAQAGPARPVSALATAPVRAGALAPVLAGFGIGAVDMLALAGIADAA